jgi:hypothetical protein
LPLSAPDAINPAFQHTRQQLLRPFRFAQWARLAFVGLLAGEMGSMGGCNGNFNWPSPDRQAPTHVYTVLPSQLARHPEKYIGLIVLFFVILLALVVLFTYIASRMRFVLFDSIVARECHIRRGWADRRANGLQLFRWEILLMLVSLGTLLIVIGVPLLCAWRVGWFAHPRQHLPAIFVSGGILLLLYLAVAVILAVIQVMTKDFVVPRMALEGIDAVEGWRRLWPQLKAEKGGYAGYIGMKIVLAIGAAILFGILTVIACLLLLIPIGGIAAAVIFGGAAAGWTWNPYTIAAAVVYGCVAMLILVFAGALISVPTVVFFPAYAIYFYAGRFPPLTAVLSTQPAPIIPAPPPGLSPPPPAAAPSG